MNFRKNVKWILEWICNDFFWKGMNFFWKATWILKSSFPSKKSLQIHSKMHFTFFRKFIAKFIPLFVRVFILVFSPTPLGIKISSLRSPIENPRQALWIGTSVWSPMKPYGALWNPGKPYGALWSPMEPYGALWSPMEPYGTLWSPMEPYETLWALWSPGMPYESLWNPTPWCVGSTFACPNFSPMRRIPRT